MPIGLVALGVAFARETGEVVKPFELGEDAARTERPLDRSPRSHRSSRSANVAGVGDLGEIGVVGDFGWMGEPGRNRFDQKRARFKQYLLNG